MYICRLQKNGTNGPISRNRDADLENRYVNRGWGKGEKDNLGDQDQYIYTTMYKIHSQLEPAIKHRKLILVLCDDLDGWDGGQEGSPRGSVCVCVCVCARAKSFQSCLTLQPYGLQPTRFLCPWGFSRWEYWSGSPCAPPGNLPNLGIKPHLIHLLYWQAGFLPLVPPGKPIHM